MSVRLAIAPSARKLNMKARDGSRHICRSPWLILRISAAFVMVSCVASASLTIAQEAQVSRNQIIAMLDAINKIHKRRDIRLDCEKYVYPYLGRSNRLKHYLDLFSAIRIKPGVTRQGADRHVGFELNYSHLQKVAHPNFRAQDIVAIVFVANGADVDSVIHSCGAILKAAPPHL